MILPLYIWRLNRYNGYTCENVLGDIYKTHFDGRESVIHNIKTTIVSCLVR